MVDSRILGWLVVVAVVSCWPSAATAQPDPLTESRDRFRHAIELVDEGDLPAALAELRQSYRLRPAYQTLYNIGTVAAALGRAVEAVDALERYLSEGESGIDPARRREVEAEIARLQRRISRLWVRCEVDGAEVAIDDVPVGTTPLAAPLRVAEGERRLTVRARGHLQSTQVVQLAGDVERTIEVTLQRGEQPRGTVRLSTRPTGASIALDGRTVGRTPLGRTLALGPGAHTVQASRAGYRAVRRTIEVREGAETALALVLQADPDAAPELLGRLDVRLPAVRHTLRVDGRRVEADRELPIGPHRVQVEVDGRLPARARVEIRARRTTRWTPALRWQGSIRLDLIESASSRRLAAWLTGLSGIAVAAAGAGIALWNEGRLDEFDQLSTDYAMACRVSTLMCTEFQGSHSVEIARQIQRVDAVAVVRWGVVVPMVAVGAAALGVGVFLLATTPSVADIDRAARGSRRGLRLRAGLMSVSLEGWL